MKQNLLFIGLTILLFIACKESNSNENIKNDLELKKTVSLIKTLGEFEKVEYEFIGNPKNNPKAVIRLNLYNSKIENLDSESIGKKCASLIFKSSDKTKDFNSILVSINFDKKGNQKVVSIIENIQGTLTTRTRNFIFKTSDL